jgi:AcrR family transcriptional regulator
MVYRQTARSEAVRAESRQRILDAAEKLLMERGYDGTTMQDIVVEAGTSIGNAYFYFGSKDGLVRDLVEGISGAILEETERAVASIPAGPARLGALIAMRVGSITSAHRGLVNLLLGTDQRLGTIQILEDLTVERWIPQLAECLPDRRANELPAIAAAIWGTNRSIVQRMALDRLALDERAAVRFSVRWNLRALGVAEPEIEAIVRSSMRVQAKWNASRRKRRD